MAHHRRDLTGATIVITGASSGFGRGSAIELAAQGANVVLAARRVDLLQDLVTEIGAAGGKAVALSADVSKSEEVSEIAALAIERFGSIDIWINNAGVGVFGLFWAVPVEDHLRLIDVNLKGVILGAHEALRRFHEQGFGTLINVGSVASEVPLAYQSSYSASKAAILSLGRALNEDLRLSGNRLINVSTIMPWAVDTPFFTHAANYSGHAFQMAAMDDPKVVIDAIVSGCLTPQEEFSAGWKAKAANVSHHLLPDTTEAMSAHMSHNEVRKAPPVPPSSGALHRPMAAGATVDGGNAATRAGQNA